MRAHARGQAHELAIEQRDRAAVGLELAGDEVEQRRLAGAVGADDEAALARLDGEIDGGGDAQAAEGFLERADGERAHRSPFAATGAGRGRSARTPQRASRTEPGTNPSGMKMTMATKIAPSTKFQRSI